MASRSRPKQTLPDLRFIKTSTLDDLLDPVNEAHMQTLAQTEQWHTTCSRDLQRRIELSQSISESCQHIREILPRIAALRARELVRPSLPNQGGDNHADAEARKATNSSSQSSALSTFPDSTSETQEFLNTLTIDPSATMSTVQASSHISLSRSPSPSDAAGSRSADSASDTVQCLRIECRTCHPPPQAILHPVDQSLSNLTALAQQWLDRLRTLRAQWNAGGKNFEDWAGFTYAQSHWLGQGEEWRQTGRPRGQFMPTQGRRGTYGGRMRDIVGRGAESGGGRGGYGAGRGNHQGGSRGRGHTGGYGHATRHHLRSSGGP